MPRKTRSTQGQADPGDPRPNSATGGASARPTGPGTRRNVALEAQESEPEDYDEENRRNVGGEGGGIKTGYYEEDYGPGARGHRHPEFHTEPRSKDEGRVLRTSRRPRARQDFPSGPWAAQRSTAKIRKVKSGKLRAKTSTGRGLGVRKKGRASGGSTIRHGVKGRRR